MTADELDSIYGELARAVTDVGEVAAPVFLARLALLALCELDDAEQAIALVHCARSVQD